MSDDDGIGQHSRWRPLSMSFRTDWRLCALALWQEWEYGVPRCNGNAKTEEVAARVCSMTVICERAVDHLPTSMHTRQVNAYNWHLIQTPSTILHSRIIEINWGTLRMQYAYCLWIALGAQIRFVRFFRVLSNQWKRSRRLFTYTYAHVLRATTKKELKQKYTRVRLCVRRSSSVKSRSLVVRSEYSNMK